MYIPLFSPKDYKLHENVVSKWWVLFYLYTVTLCSGIYWRLFKLFYNLIWRLFPSLPSSVFFWKSETTPFTIICSHPYRFCLKIFHFFIDFFLRSESKQVQVTELMCPYLNIFLQKIFNISTALFLRIYSFTPILFRFLLKISSGLIEDNTISIVFLSNIRQEWLCSYLYCSTTSNKMDLVQILPNRWILLISLLSKEMDFLHICIL